MNSKNTYRNLTKDETKEVINAFFNFLKSIKINNKNLILNITQNQLVMNQNINMDEIYENFKIKENNIEDIISKLYLYKMHEIIKELIQDDILNIPIISFSQSGNIIKVNY